MTTHSSVLTWGIPWTEKPGGLQSKGSHRVRHNRTTHTHTPPHIDTLPCGSAGEESARNAGDLGSTPGSGRSPGAGNDNPFQYSCLENPMNRGARWATVHGVAKSRTQLSE